MTTGEFPPHLDTGDTHIRSREIAIWAGEVNVFKNAKRASFFFKGPFAAQTVFVDDDDFAGFHVADEFGVNEVKRATLGGQHVGPIELADAKRPKAVRVTKTDDLALAHEYDGECPLQAPQGRDSAARTRGLGQQMQHDLTIHGGLKNGALFLEFRAQRSGVDEVSIVSDGELSACGIDHEWLGIFERARAGGGITNMPDRA